jgi:lysophospholipase L1-like esterase
MELFRRARAANRSMTFVGSQMNGPTNVDGVTFPRRHEGHSGWKINEIAALVPAPALNDVPHIVLVMAGTNDMIQNDTVATAPQRMGALLDKIFAGAPQALVVMARLTPLMDMAQEARVMAYNNALPGLVQARVAQGRHVILIDMHTGFPSAELADGIHPTTAGYNRMAGVWYAAIGDLLP